MGTLCRRCWMLVIGLLVGVCVGTGNATHASGDASLDAGEGLKVSVRASCAFVQGEARELVYSQSFFGSREKLSELIWDIEQVVMAGGVVTISKPEWHKARFSLGGWTAITQGNGGQMVDYDWFFGDDWSDRSISDVDVVDALLIDVNASAEVFTWEGISVRGLVGYKQDHWSWEDWGGSYIYSEGGGFRNVEGTFEDAVGIEYEQTFQIPYVGVELEGAVGGMAWSCYALYSPIVSAEDKDYHVLRDIHFEEEFSGGEYYAVGVQGAIDVGERFFVSGSLDFQTVPEFQGDLTIVETGETAYGGAGIEHTSTTISFSAGLRL